MPPSDPACPTCGTRVRANCYWDYLSGPFSPRVYYPKSIMDDNPEIAGSFTRCADPFHAHPSDPAAACPCGSHSADWEAGGKLLCARCAANVVFASGSFVTPAAVPPPEWAVNIALEEFDEGRIDLGFVDPLARLLASVREAAIRDAGATSADVMDIYKQRQADTRKTLPFGWTIFAGRTRDRWREQVGAGIGAMVCRDAILSLLHTPPSGGGA